MAEITNLRRGEILRGIFRILKDYPDGLKAKDVLVKLEQIVPPTEFEASNFPKNPNLRRYEKLARFHTIPTVKAGWLYKEKGVWSLTDAGIEAYDKYKDPESFQKEATRLYKEWEKEKPPIDLDDDEETTQALISLEEAEESAWTSIEEYVQNINPYDFQKIVSGLIEAMEYYVFWVSPPGPDKGIDIIAYQDPLGVKGPRIKIQVKRRKDKIDVEGVRSFMALLAEGDVGLFISLGGFTKEATSEVRTQEKRRLKLLDLKSFFDLWVEYYEQISEEHRKLLPLKKVYFLLPRD